MKNKVHKIRTIYCEEKGVQDGDPSHSPPTPLASLGPEAADLGGKLALASFGGFWRVLLILASFPKTHTFCNNS